MQQLTAQVESLQNYETSISKNDTVINFTVKKSELTDLRKYITTLEYIAKKYENNLDYLDTMESKLVLLETKVDNFQKLYEFEITKNQLQSKIFENELKRIKEERKLKQRQNLLNGIGIGAIGGTLI